MSESTRKWDDLRARLISAMLIGVVGIGAIVLGGIWLNFLVALFAAVMIWELVRMLSPEQLSAAQVLSAFTGILVILFNSEDYQNALFLSLGMVVIGVMWLKKGRAIFLIYAPVIIIGAISAFVIRMNLGLNILLLVVGVVIITDVAGYFVGRIVGGPKFWPKVSPKKTWSGTVGGWIGAALISVPFAEPGFGVLVAIVAIILAFASQLGDIGESAIKRRSGVKDSSALLPGHGGFLDRFDGMIAALAASYIVWIMISGWPVVG
ncbi:MAG: phosphatidate cytidylyltransferase [Marinosulfonomonas sp.]|nr:phosphatidate cytidylyltransferase [Marinosulfonomonas sp.]